MRGLRIILMVVFVGLLAGVVWQRIPDRGNQHLLTSVDRDQNVYSSDSLAPNDPFVFVFGSGSGWMGYDMCKISSIDSTVVYVFRKSFETTDANGDLKYSYEWRKVATTIPPELIESLRKKLNEIAVFDLHKGYHASVCDGGQQFVRLCRGRDDKNVYCNNYFPSEVQELVVYVNHVLKILQLHQLSPTGQMLSQEEYWECYDQFKNRDLFVNDQSGRAKTIKPEDTTPNDAPIDGAGKGDAE